MTAELLIAFALGVAVCLTVCRWPSRRCLACGEFKPGHRIWWERKVPALWAEGNAGGVHAFASNGSSTFSACGAHQRSGPELRGSFTPCAFCADVLKHEGYKL